MTKEELLKQLESNQDGLAWTEGEHEGKLGLFIHWQNPRKPEPADDDELFVIHVQYDALGDLDFKTIVHQAVAGRDVVQMTRIVGYFSRVDNWNKSKLGELRDRHQGNYSLSGRARHMENKVTMASFLAKHRNFQEQGTAVAK